MGPQWSSKPGECAGDTKGTGADSRQPAAKAIADCAQGKEKVTAESLYPATSSGVVTYGASSAKTSIERIAGKGLFARAESWSDGISIEGVGSIGRVHSIAEARSNGRIPKPGDAPRTVFTVELCGVTTPTFQQQGCQDPAAAVAALNQAGRGRIVFSRPLADEQLKKGTPRGYLAGLQRDPGEASLARVENGDDLLLIPGLEMQVRNTVTSEEPHRYIYHFAGVRSVAAYGVARLPEAVADPDPGPASVEDALTVTEDASAPAPTADIPVEIVRPAASVATTRTESITERIFRTVRDGFKFVFRDPVEGGVAVAAWSIVGTPAYLAFRRRRLHEELVNAGES
jgi:hypothetical protein